MDPIQIKKIHAMNANKRRQILDNLYFFFLTAFTCSAFCCTTFCLPYLASLARLFILVMIPDFASVLLSSKLLFIIGNLIIFALIVDSRIFSSQYDSSSSTYVYCYDEYIRSSLAQRPQFKRNVAENVEMNVEEERKGSVVSGYDELNRRADEFIARVIRQRRLELSLLTA